MKIAVWSGPRNLSTAMMYSFSNRADCTAVDEPFYAYYLKQTGKLHPMYDRIIQSQVTQPKAIIAQLTGDNPEQAKIYYQKHMTHHMLPELSLDWAQQLHNIILIRHPARVIASYNNKVTQISVEDVGVLRQHQIYRQLCALGTKPLIIDSDTILQKPERALQNLCRAIGIPFDNNMLLWHKGGSRYDGIWAKHWYDAIWSSTGFVPSSRPLPQLQGESAAICQQLTPTYLELKQQAMTL